MGAAVGFAPIIKQQPAAWELPAAVENEIRRLYALGYSLEPLKGPDGKEAYLPIKQRRVRLGPAMMLSELRKHRSATFGVHLAGLLVVDVDSDTAEAEDFVDAHFPKTPVQVKSRRGRHLYFRHNGRAPAEVELPGVVIQFITGRVPYVVGACSVRPDGGVVYAYEDVPLGRPADLPFFVFKDPPARAQKTRRTSGSRAGAVPVGQRHGVMLKGEARRLALGGAHFEAMLRILREYRDENFEDPASFPDAEIIGIINWCLEKRSAGELWEDGLPRMNMPIAAFDDLGRSGDFNALALLNYLYARYGGKQTPFSIVAAGIKGDGLKMGKNQIYEARNRLIERGWIRCIAAGSRASCEPASYAFTLPPHVLQMGGGIPFSGESLYLGPSPSPHAHEHHASNLAARSASR